MVHYSDWCAVAYAGHLAASSIKKAGSLEHRGHLQHIEFDKLSFSSDNDGYCMYTETEVPKEYYLTQCSQATSAQVLTRTRSRPCVSSPHLARTLHIRFRCRVRINVRASGIRADPGNMRLTCGTGLGLCIGPVYRCS